MLTISKPLSSLGPRSVDNLSNSPCQEKKCARRQPDGDQNLGPIEAAASTELPENNQLRK
jgi:hypothetical protein